MIITGSGTYTAFRAIVNALTARPRDRVVLLTVFGNPQRVLVHLLGTELAIFHQFESPGSPPPSFNTDFPDAIQVDQVTVA